MPLNGGFIQMLSALSEIQTRKKTLELQGKQYEQGIKEWEHEHHDKDITGYVQQLVAANADSRQAILALASKNVSQDDLAALSSFAKGMPIDPRVLAAEGTQRGVTAMQGTPQGQQVDQENAMRNATGQGAGQIANSGFQAKLFGGQVNPALPAQAQAMAATGMNPQQAAIWQSQQAQGLVPRMAGIQAGTQVSAPQAASNALQQYANITQRDQQMSSSELGWAGLRQQNTQMAQEFGLKLGAEVAKSGITPKEIMDGQNDLAKYLAQMGDPKTDKGGRDKLVKLFNSKAAMLGLYSTLGINDPSEAPAKVAALSQWIQNSYGVGVGSGIQPGSPQAQPPQNPIQQMLPQNPLNPTASFGMPSMPSYVPTPYSNPFIPRQP